MLADAAGLLTCYGVGEDSSAALPHAVVELCFTSSVRFLQPGLLLQVSAVLSWSVLWALLLHRQAWVLMNFCMLVHCLESTSDTSLRKRGK